MSGQQSYKVTRALKWMSGYTLGDQRTVKQAAKKFKVHETTLWRAIGRASERPTDRRLK